MKSNLKKRNGPFIYSSSYLAFRKMANKLKTVSGLFQGHFVFKKMRLVLFSAVSVQLGPKT